MMLGALAVLAGAVVLWATMPYEVTIDATIPAAWTNADGLVEARMALVRRSATPGEWLLSGESMSDYGDRTRAGLEKSAPPDAIGSLALYSWREDDPSTLRAVSREAWTSAADPPITLDNTRCEDNEARQVSRTKNAVTIGGRSTDTGGTVMIAAATCGANRGNCVTVLSAAGGTSVSGLPGLGAGDRPTGPYYLDVFSLSDASRIGRRCRLRDVDIGHAEVSWLDDGRTLAVWKRGGIEWLFLVSPKQWNPGR